MLSISSQLQHMDPVTSMLSLLENILILSEKTAFTFPFSFFFFKAPFTKEHDSQGGVKLKSFHSQMLPGSIYGQQQERKRNANFKGIPSLTGSLTHIYHQV
uniref:Uncharacterized protein n=1 Tax=Mus musculus TaxID=10090 RepID=Q8CB95_MOUSE|nr:unnamed protein product [Mus musculus]